MCTVAVEPRAVMCRNRCHIVVTLTVTVYRPRASLCAMKPASTPQPRWIPHALLSWNGSDAHCSGNGDFGGAFGSERCGL